MRLDVPEHGHRMPAKVFQSVGAVVFRNEMSDVARTAMHRPAFFGRPFLKLCTDVLRGPLYWTTAERE